MKPDAKIKADVLLELKWNSGISHRNINVEVNDGIVTLSGTVPSFLEKREAEKAVERVSGIKAVVEGLKVVLSATPLEDDQLIAKAIVDQFRSTPHIPELLIRVSVEDGWVTLTGEVEKESQCVAARKIVRSLDGVKGVSNNITIATKTEHPAIVKTNRRHA